jgi:hypothetical protein
MHFDLDLWRRVSLAPRSLGSPRATFRRLDVKRLALFWLACAAAGFGLAAGIAVMLCLAVDGPGVWRHEAPRLAQAER